MAAIHSYLLFKDNCEEAFNHYRNIFGGNFERIVRFKDMPMSDDSMPDDVANLIMHIGLPVGKGHMLMGSDCPPGWAARYKLGNNVNLSLLVNSREEADRFHKGLSEGGTVKEPMADAPWGDYFGMLTDRFGIEWMISYDPTGKYRA
jgi:PhnB protein